MHTEFYSKINNSIDCVVSSVVVVITPCVLKLPSLS